MIKNNTTQEYRVLEALKNADGGWLYSDYFIYTLHLSQFHRALHNLQNKRDKYSYEGMIDVSDFTDEHGYKAYRILKGANIPKNETNAVKEKDERSLKSFAPKMCDTSKENSDIFAGGYMRTLWEI